MNKKLKESLDNWLLEKKYSHIEKKFLKEYRCTKKELSKATDSSYYIPEEDPNGEETYQLFQNTVVPDEFSAEELRLLLEFHRTKNIETTKKCIVFFTVLVIIELIIGGIIALAIFN